MARKRKNINSQLEDRITKARANIVMDSPFFGSLICRMEHIPRPGTQTMATDGRHVYYEPDFVEQLTDAQLKGVSVHEVMHCALSHHARLQDRNPRVWNMACDYAINPIIKNSGFSLPEPHLDDPQYHNMNADEIYHELMKHAQHGGGGGGSIDDPWNFGRMESPTNDDGTEMDDEEIQQEIEDWKSRLASAANAARVMGNLPSDLERFVDDYLTVKLNWKELLARFMHSTTKNDFNWSRPNRSFLINHGVYLPTLHNEAVGHVAIAVDTSGSIDNEVLQEFTAEVNGVLNQTRPEKVHTIYCDATVQHTEEFTPDQYPVRLEARGGGGTDFRPVFDYLNENDIKVACLIYLTDMYGTFPDEEPEYPVMWVSNSGVKEAPFGQVVELT